MIAFEINGERVEKLSIDGYTKDLYRELTVGVTETLKQLDMRNASGEKIPLSKSVLEFGQLLCIIATECSKELDGGEPHDEEGNESD